MRTVRHERCARTKSSAFSAARASAWWAATEVGSAAVVSCSAATASAVLPASSTAFAALKRSSVAPCRTFAP